MRFESKRRVHRATRTAVQCDVLDAANVASRCRRRDLKRALACLVLRLLLETARSRRSLRPCIHDSARSTSMKRQTPWRHTRPRPHLALSRPDPAAREVRAAGAKNWNSSRTLSRAPGARSLSADTTTRRSRCATDGRRSAPRGRRVQKQSPCCGRRDTLLVSRPLVVYQGSTQSVPPRTRRRQLSWSANRAPGWRLPDASGPLV